MAAIIKDEFRLERFKLAFPHKEPFYNFLWEWPSWGFIIYRSISSAYTLFAFIHYLATWPVPTTAAVFLATWSYLVLTLHFNVSLIICIWIFVQDKKKSSPTSGKNTATDLTGSTNGASSGMTSFNVIIGGPDNETFPWYLSLSWCLADIAYVCGITTTILFYFLEDQTYSFVNVNIYTLNAIFIYVDLYLSAIPLRILHFIYPVAFGLAYGLINIIYWAANPSTNIVYPTVLNWNDPLKASFIFLGSVLLIIPAIQVIFFGVYRMSLGTFKWVYKREYDKQQMPVSNVTEIQNTENSAGAENNTK